jgi:hypothetical protein
LYASHTSRLAIQNGFALSMAVIPLRVASGIALNDGAPSVRSHYSTIYPVGSEEAPTEGLASVRRSNWTCSFPASSFHEWVIAI